jgi:HSP20 family protein
MFRTLVNLNPVSELQQFAELVDRAFGENYPARRAEQTETALILPVDISERDGKVLIKAAVPGVRPEDLEVSIDNDVLTIRGETKDTFEQNEKVYRREYRYGTFSRSIRLPENVNKEAAEANFEHGFVTISLPRVEPPKPKALKVQVKDSSGQRQQMAIEGTATEKNSSKSDKKAAEPVGTSNN